MKYLNQLQNVENIKLKNGNTVTVFELKDIPQKDFEEWAEHFRQAYCLDSMIDALRKGTGLSRRDYLLNMVFPSTKGFGPGTKLGDFAELLIADYLTYFYGYYVPKDRYVAKFNRNTSSQGTDVLGLKTFSSTSTANDELVLIEVKAKAVNACPINRLEEAVKDIENNPDEKCAVTLNAIKHRALYRHDHNTVHLVERFQDYANNPYIKKYGAAAVQDTLLYDKSLVKQTKAKASTKTLLFIKRDNLMDLVKKLYEKAADI